MITREIQHNLPELSRGFPVVTITGPRQSGKTTLAKMAYPEHTYLDLENLAIRSMAKEDPKSLIKDSQGNYILDEIQYVPEILSHVKVLVDQNQIDSQFVLTGSNQFSLMRNLSQSLAGRTAIFDLLPFSLSEANQPDKDLNTIIFKGMYPRLICKNINPSIFYDAYIRSYLQQDVRQLVNVQSIEVFNRFLGLCAGRTGSILNKVSLANDCGVDAKTVSNWLSILQTSYVIHLLPPWHGNVSKRLIKSPKLYFCDTGLACRLLQIRNTNDLSNHPLRGNLFETLIVSEALKFYYNRGIRPPLFYYRESNGSEIDLIADRAGVPHPFEIKSALLVKPSAYANILKFRALGIPTGPGRLVYTGEQTWSHPSCRNISWRDFQGELKDMEKENM